ncbi:MAG: toxin-antitoxin system HicB family antitoxin, partial [Bacteroidota bacterium]|nr:toxin-antitoxin system HicB family antitoxin [Bacteroidota bacterium]
RGLVSYEGETGKDLEKDFISAIDEYISLCKAEGISIEKPFKGSFNVRIPVDLHKKAVLLAREEQISLNSFVAESIRSRLIKQAHK